MDMPDDSSYCTAIFDAQNNKLLYEGSKKFKKGIKVSHSIGGLKFFDGAWVEWEGDENQLIIRTSPHGMLPLYYRELSRGIAVSTHISKLLTISPKPNLDFSALSVMFRLGNFLGEATHFKEIKVIPANSTLKFSGGVVEIRKNKISHSDGLREITLNEAVDEYIHLMKCSIQRRFPERDFVLPISAGRDSRHILFELLENKYRPVKLITSSHYLPTSNTEILIAKKISEKTNLDLQILLPDRNKANLQFNSKNNTDYCVNDHYWAADLANELSRHPLSYDGLNGGVLFGRTTKREKYDALYRAGKLEELADSLLHVNEIALSGMLAPEMYSKIPRDLAIQETIDELSKFKKLNNSLVAFLHANHVRRRTAYYTYKMIDHGNVLCPIDDFEIVNFALSLPPGISNDPSFQTIAIRKAFPGYSDLPFDNELRSEWKNDDFSARKKAVTILKNLHYYNKSVLLDKRWILRKCISTMVQGTPSSLNWWSESAIYLMNLSKHPYIQ